MWLHIEDVGIHPTDKGVINSTAALTMVVGDPNVFSPDENIEAWDKVIYMLKPFYMMAIV